MALIICPECSGKLSTKADACPHCGYAPAAKTLSEIQPPQVMAQPVQRAREEVYPPVYATSRETPKKNNSGWYGLLVILLGVAGFFVYKSSESGKTGGLRPSFSGSGATNSTPPQAESAYQPTSPTQTQEPTRSLPQPNSPPRTEDVAYREGYKKGYSEGTSFGRTYSVSSGEMRASTRRAFASLRSTPSWPGKSPEWFQGYMDGLLKGYVDEGGR